VDYSKLSAGPTVDNRNLISRKLIAFETVGTLVEDRAMRDVEEAGI
jgi:hypothetical protein